MPTLRTRLAASAFAAAAIASSPAHANYFGFNGITENQTYQLEFTSRTIPNNTYFATMSISSIGGYGGIQQGSGTGDRRGLFSLWDTNDTSRDCWVAGLNPFLTFMGRADHRFDGEGTGSQLLFQFAWKDALPYRMAWRRFVVPGGDKVRYATFFHDPHSAGGWVWVGTFQKPQTTSGARNMNGFETFSEDWAGTGGTREIDIRNVWLLDLGNQWRNITRANMWDDRDNGRLWAIAGGWRHHSYDPKYSFEGVSDLPMSPDTTLKPIHLPYLINAGANIEPSIDPHDQVGRSLTQSFEPDAYWQGTSKAASSTAAIDTAGVKHAAPKRLYQDWREGDSFGYTLFGLNPGKTTKVRLHFVEPKYDTAGARRQSVEINGTIVENKLDIRAAAGARHRALVRTYQVTAGQDGQIVIKLKGLVAGAPALVAGIEAVPQ